MNSEEYLRQINIKMGTNNNYLNNIDDQTAEVQYYTTQIYNKIVSGDIEINNKLNIIQNNQLILAITMTLLLTYTFIKGCFRC